MRVKICGITREEDARLAASLGAWAIGFVFWPGSPRSVDPAHARAIAAALPSGVTTVGVFVNQPREHVEHVARVVGLGAVQLHGDEAEASFEGMSVPVIRAMSVEQARSEGVLDSWRGATLLLDAIDPERRGGTGQPIDWTSAAAVARRRPVLLAGGLRPGNVADAVRAVRPSGIDVSSGVERAPGIKDPDRLTALFAALRGAEAREEVR